jgi:hypothetical protein
MFAKLSLEVPTRSAVVLDQPTSPLLTQSLPMRPLPPLPAVSSQVSLHSQMMYVLMRFAGPAVDPTSSNTTSGPHSSDLANKADPRVDSDNDRNTSSGGIGSSSWMSTALPHRDVKNTTSSNESSSKSSASAGSGTTTQKSEPSAQGTGLEDIKSQPPNNLPDKVPTGTSTDFVVSGSTPSATTGASSAAAAGSIPSSSTNTTADAMHAHQDIPTENVDSSTLSTSQPSHPVEGHRDSIVNPDAIPTAGGKKIGEDAYVERKSMQADSIDPGLPTAAATSANTTRNVGTAEATGTPSTFEHGLEHEKKSSVTSGSSETEHKEKKGLTEKIKNKLHIHKH